MFYQLLFFFLQILGVFSLVGIIFNQFSVDCCLGLTLFDMTIHLKTAMLVSEYMELIPDYLSLV